MKNKFSEHFDAGTQTLQGLVATIPFASRAQNDALSGLVAVLRNGFKLCAVRQEIFGAPEVKRWAGEHKNIPVFSKSFCDSSSYIIFTKFAGEFDFMYITREDWAAGGPHCYLRHKSSGIIFDITYDQYTAVGIDIPYNKGRAINPNAKEWSNERAIKLARLLNLELKR